MIDAPAPIEWRIGPRYVAAAVAVHALSGCAAVTIALRWPIAWAMVALAGASAAFDAKRLLREWRAVHRVRLTVWGVTWDGVDFEVRDAWLALGWTVLWLADPRGRTRLLYVHLSELGDERFAALRRHVKALLAR